MNPKRRAKWRGDFFVAPPLIRAVHKEAKLLTQPNPPSTIIPPNLLLHQFYWHTLGVATSEHRQVNAWYPIVSAAYRA